MTLHTQLKITIKDVSATTLSVTIDPKTVEFSLLKVFKGGPDTIKPAVVKSTSDDEEEEDENEESDEYGQKMEGMMIHSMVNMQLEKYRNQYGSKLSKTLPKEALQPQWIECFGI
jgi:hypothetical protein